MLIIENPNKSKVFAGHFCSSWRIWFTHIGITKVSFLTLIVYGAKRKKLNLLYGPKGMMAILLFSTGSCGLEPVLSMRLV